MLIDTDDLVGIVGIARACGVTDAAVCNWLKRHPAFPDPILTIGGVRLWLRQPVKAWVLSTGRSYDEHANTARPPY